MYKLSEEIIIIIGVTASLLIVAIGIISLFLVYRNKQQQLLQEKEKLLINFNQQLLQSQLEMQEQTFNIISQEIHDNVGQSLSLAKVQLNILERGEILDKSLIAEAKDSLSKALTDLRDIAKSLQSERIQQFSLPEIVSQELLRISRSGLLLTNIHVEGEECNIPDQKKLILFRTIQETLQNIIKHANARSVEVNCKYCDDRLEIKVSDNGQGFDTNVLTRRDGLGLSNIINRAALIGGEAHIESKLNEGTTITIITPYV